MFVAALRREVDERREIRTTGEASGGLAVLLREVLQELGMDVDNIFYEGCVYGPGEGVLTRLQMTVPRIPGMVGSLKLEAAASESTYTRAVKTVAMGVLRLMTLVYEHQLRNTCYRYLLQALDDRGDRTAVNLLVHAADRERYATLRTTVQYLIEQEYLNTGLEEKVAILREKVWKRENWLMEKDRSIALLEERLVVDFS